MLGCVGQPHHRRDGFRFRSTHPPGRWSEARLLEVPRRPRYFAGLALIKACAITRIGPLLLFRLPQPQGSAGRVADDRQPALVHDRHDILHDRGAE